MDDTARPLILQEREKTNGKFKDQGAFAHGLKAYIQIQPTWQWMSPAQREALDLIATKISRLCHGDPQYKDHWKDIAGYAELGAEDCD